MAKKQKPSMLTRQRQLRAQQQQVRRASQNNLPPRGGSGGGRGGAVTPRPNSAPATPAGKLAKSPRGQAADQRIERVKVRVVKPSTPAMSGRPQAALPPGARGRGGVGAALTGIAAGKALGAGIAGAYNKAIRRERTDNWRASGGAGRYTPRGQQEGGGMGGVGNIPPQEGRVNNPNYGKSQKPQAAATPNRSASNPRVSGSSRPSAPVPAKSERFTGTVEEGRKIWADKYSSDKYKGQAINKEAKAYLDKLKIAASSPAPEASTKKSDSGAGSNAMNSNSKALEANKQATSFNTDKLEKRKGKSYGISRA